MFDDHLKRRDLTSDGDSIVTHSSSLLPVRQLLPRPCSLKL